MSSKIVSVLKSLERQNLRNTCTRLERVPFAPIKLLADGRRQIGAFHLPGDIFGVENGDLHRFTAEAIVKTTVWIAKRRSLFGGSAEGNIPATKVRELVTRSLEHAENHLLLLGRQTALEKVAAFLIEMDRRL